jgi:hypothetical protein
MAQSSETRLQIIGEILIKAKLLEIRLFEQLIGFEAFIAVTMRSTTFWFSNALLVQGTYTDVSEEHTVSIISE